MVLNKWDSPWSHHYHPHGHMVEIWTLGNWLTLKTVTVTCSQVNPICDLCCWFPTSKINGGRSQGAQKHPNSNHPSPQITHKLLWASMQFYLLGWFQLMMLGEERSWPWPTWDPTWFNTFSSQPAPLDLAERTCCRTHWLCLAGFRRHPISAVAPVLWNIFPLEFSLAPSLLLFWKVLKT